jgi:hypothetical protein
MTGETTGGAEGEDLGIRLVYTEGALWESSCGKALERPSDEYMTAFDSFFVITNSNNPEPQYPVAEIGPPHPNYDGMWRTFTATWTDKGIFAYGTVPILESYSDILLQSGLGHMEITPGPPPGGGTPAFFSCNLVPWKEEPE